MNCVRCGKPLPKKGYFRTKKGPHHAIGECSLPRCQHGQVQGDCFICQLRVMRLEGDLMLDKCVANLFTAPGFPEMFVRALIKLWGVDEVMGLVRGPETGACKGITVYGYRCLRRAVTQEGLCW